MRPYRSLHLQRLSPPSKITPCCPRQPPLIRTCARRHLSLPSSTGPQWWRKYREVPEELLVSRVRNPLNYMEREKRRVAHNSFRKRRMLVCSIGITACVALQFGLVFMVRNDGETKDGGIGAKTDRLDAPAGKDGRDLEGRDIVKEKPGQPEIKLDAQGNEFVETGTSTIPHFPRTIQLPSSTDEVTAGAAPGENDQYTLLGLGIRTVSFLSIQVYVLGLYVRTTDLPQMQAAFVKHINPIGSSLIPGEKTELRKQLLDGEESAKVWDKILREVGVRSVVRILPTRNTDFGHLRDGWVRGITARTQEAAARGEGASYEDEGFGEAMKSFKALFGGKGKAPKGSEVLLSRDERGRLSVAYREIKEKEDKREMRVKEQMGMVEEERISRLVWLGYLGGRNVSSEGARKNIVDGVMELVERPVGTVGVQIS